MLSLRQSYTSVLIWRLFRMGIADEQLAKREEERGRKRSADPDEIDRPRKRSRSSSSYSSVSTISTNRSRSVSPRPSRSRDRDIYYTSQQDHPSLPSHGRPSFLKRGRRTRSPSSSYSSESLSGRRKTTKARDDDRNTRRRHSAISPHERGRRHDAGATPYDRCTRSRSMDRSRIARDRRSMTPAMREGERGRHNASLTNRKADTAAEDDRRNLKNSDRYRRGSRAQGSPPRNGRQGAAPVPPRKERSLSPFSKRLALTQAMNMGR